MSYGLVFVKLQERVREEICEEKSFEDDLRKTLVPAGMASPLANDMGLASTAPVLDGYAFGMSSGKVERERRCGLDYLEGLLDGDLLEWKANLG